ncbi:iron-containing alcohol dehydrogenase [Pediococcus claussenii]|uniref:NADH-dependent butanol dehydrogenase A n=1 Tax=Pediococcus claussenii (strain ATCC BAA-344 / DSM 14800 / JCM 18046 / KCTC 3811 / LMG 21948 / P06) TaxID=701521 RepID=G8PCB8_PEDCP|nr:iron-containing alcohol dehydrogenase [Pediococcus claussenii]AEV94903.1 NADH-dependent butanol dehydrogenase A [Pediococcus claussenii ATCC BAA-344]ANZ70099.1 butanol dehydrogenase [Pediococcus claussenii]ANZ71914.1 butanol dehydrogenase [Pediococcus claussenii]KRN18846.1 bdhA protein [Pediococcus claussenii]
MENFTYKNSTEIRFGTDRIDNEIHDAVAQFGDKVLLVYGGQSIKKSGLYDRVIDQLADLQITELSGIEPNPKINSIREGQKLAKENDIDVILAVGGGSVIDASKVIASAKFYDSDPWDLVVQANGADRMKLDQVPLVDILTLSATGTEMNFGSVISNPETHQKLGTSGPNSPAISFLDPTLTYTVSKWQTAAGSMDIMSHLIEQYFNHTTTNDASSGMIEGLMRSVIKWAPVALKEPENYDARANLMWTATMALNGIVRSGNEGGWTVHGLEHELSAYYDITHGVGLGILTPRWMDWVIATEPKTVARFAQFGRQVWNIQGKDDTEVAQAAIKTTYDWISSLGFPMTLPGVDIKDETNFEAMAEGAIKSSALDKVAYVPVHKEDAISIYRASM